jgi:hypothetical protein
MSILGVFSELAFSQAPIRSNRRIDLCIAEFDIGDAKLESVLSEVSSNRPFQKAFIAFAHCSPLTPS